jgi:hypothetical protein
VKFANPHLAAPQRLSLYEVRSVFRFARRERRGSLTIGQIRELVTAERLRELPQECRADQAAWALCIDRRLVYRWIHSGKLPVRKEPVEGTDRVTWFISREDVERIAQERKK